MDKKNGYQEWITSIDEFELEFDSFEFDILSQIKNQLSNINYQISKEITNNKSITNFKP